MGLPLDSGIRLHSRYRHGSRNLIKCPDSMIDSTTDSVIISHEKDKLIVVKGLDNYLVVNTDDVLMICPRDEGRFKEVIADLAVNDKSKYM